MATQEPKQSKPKSRSARSQTKLQPVIYHFLKKYQENPSSRVFAPLTEAYRRAGLLDEAIEIAREGLRYHPNFMGGRVALARALFDKQNYQGVVDELAPVVDDIPDNLVAQRLLAESYLILGRLVEALGAYKMLLFFAPQDTEAAKIAQELEVEAYQQGTLILRSDSQTVRSTDSAQGVRSTKTIQKIELLQGLLQRVERYRMRAELTSSPL